MGDFSSFVFIFVSNSLEFVLISVVHMLLLVYKSLSLDPSELSIDYREFF